MSGDPVEWLMERERPVFFFAPQKISEDFFPFGRLPGEFDIEDRIIAPVKDKSIELKRAFVCAAYQKACGLVRASGTVVAIGYSFNAHDSGSYQRVLRALSASVERRLIVVSLDALKVAPKLQMEFPNLRVEPMETTFTAWAAASFIGI